MKTEKQKLLLRAIKEGGYILYPSGTIERNGKALSEVIRPSGYVQCKFYYRENNDLKYIQAYTHEVMWLLAHGTFPEKKRVAFKDDDPSNVALSNLFLTDRKMVEVKVGVVRPVRKEQIESIRFYLRGGERNYAKIARELNLTRSSVSRTARKILAGEELKFDTDTVISPKNKVELWKRKQQRQAA